MSGKRRFFTLAILFSFILAYGLGIISVPFLPKIRRAHADTETKYATSHITGTFSTPTNAVGSTAGTWAGDLNTNINYTSRWAMDDPSGALSGTQTISVLARKGSNSGTPTIALNLYENGTLVQSIAAATNVTSTTGQTISGTFSGAAITNRNNVEIEVVEVSAGGSPSARNSAQIDYIQWTVNFSPNITVGTSGTQVSTLNIGAAGSYIGGTFTFVRDSGSANITQIILTKAGTVADANLSNVKLFYKAEAVCSSTIPSGATSFNASGVNFSSSKATATGTMSVGTSQICVYVQLDVGSGASVGDTIEISISNPSTEVTAASGTVSPNTAVAIAGTTTLQAPPCPTADQVMRHGSWFNNGTEQPFSGADATCGG